MTTSTADRVANDEIRAWARQAGWPGISERGRIPAEVRDAYEAFHGVPAGPDPSEDGDPEDFSGADEPDDDEPVSRETEDTRPPPPASLDEARARVKGDAPAAHLGKRKKEAGGPKPPPIKITKAVVGDIEGKLAFWMSIPADVWIAADPYCGQAYADSIPAMAKGWAPVLCQSPDVVRWFSKSTTFMLWTEALMASKPVLAAIVAHHITRRVELDERGVAVPAGGADFSAYASNAA